MAERRERLKRGNHRLAQYVLGQMLVAPAFDDEKIEYIPFVFEIYELENIGVAIP